MEKKEKQELIEAIKQGLLSLEEVPYREGAWESFRSNHPIAVRPKKTYTVYWGSAAAAVALLLLFGVLYRDGFLSDPQTDHPEHDMVAGPSQVPSSGPSAAPDVGETAIFAEPPLDPSPPADDFLADETLRKPFIPERENTSALMLPSTPSANGKMAAHALSGRMEAVRPKIEPIDRPVFASLDLRNQSVLAQKAVPNTAGLSTAMQPFLPAKTRLTERLEIGAFLSPGTTGENFNMGGGLLLGYRLTDRLSVRAGASFNQYEVGTLASRLADDTRTEREMESPPVPGEDGHLLARNIPYRASSVLLPNLDAVSGRVQTLDVPVELKYHFGARFYAVAGVSYAAVLSQERYNHYREHVDPLTYSSDSDSGRPVEQNPTAAETTVRKTSDENVRSNGFGGFANLSLGRRTRLSKALIGRFKRADMDYTNGGVKIIVLTNWEFNGN